MKLIMIPMVNQWNAYPSPQVRSSPTAFMQVGGLFRASHRPWLRRGGPGVRIARFSQPLRLLTKTFQARRLCILQTLLHKNGANRSGRQQMVPEVRCRVGAAGGIRWAAAAAVVFAGLPAIR
jgi:hypothetical protein